VWGRLHYCAADTDTHGANAEWGEHEMDYILFVQATVELQPHPEEVSLLTREAGELNTVRKRR
jgi:isopentenyldiphosphate isomerase